MMTTSNKSDERVLLQSWKTYEFQLQQASLWIAIVTFCTDRPRHVRQYYCPLSLQLSSSRAIAGGARLARVRSRRAGRSADVTPSLVQIAAALAHRPGYIETPRRTSARV
ncbi:uncharacterized protein PV09_03612 [Verruconis gallopava]|uniref:Uncharacterized protein n=1 Tax=Verruconis gallopava TaxID=253628 RepID=A0A0D1XSN7_9PEZI|nr:uncharacterized protein PV09_03612 [Verruconis gallopava]KIW05756.1 hypothetical protein PV09_03612 [Verruconis gallopava]